MKSFLVDELAFAPATIAAGNAAIGLWARADSWSGGAYTNGFIPKAIAKIMGKPSEIRALIDQRMWIEAVGDDTHGAENVGVAGYISVGYVDRNGIDHMAKRAKDAELSAVRAENGRKGGKASGEVRAAKQQAEQNEAFASHPINQTVNQTPDFASRNRSKIEAPEPAPDPDQNHVSTHVSGSTDALSVPDPAAAAAEQKILNAVEEMIAVAVRIRERQSGHTIRSPRPWRAQVSQNIRAEYAQHWANELRECFDLDRVLKLSVDLPCDVVTVARAWSDHETEASRREATA